MPDPTPLLSDAQLAGVLAVLSGGFAGIAGAIKWSATRLVGVVIKNAETNAILVTKVDSTAKKIDAIAERIMTSDSTPVRIPKPATDSTRRRPAERRRDDDNDR